MAEFENVAVLFRTLPDGRQYLTEQQTVENPWLRDFVWGFPDAFEYDFLARIYVLKPQ